MRPVIDLELHKKTLEKMLTDKIHYGCGKHILRGWLNVDGFDESYPDGCVDPKIAENIFCCDLKDRHPFPSNYFKFGYSEDFLEHLDQADSLFFLEEVYRTFAPGGVVRFSFPSLEGVLKKHYNTIDYEVFRLGKKDAYTTWTHKHFYSKDSLTLVAKHIGFRDIHLVEYGISKYPELNNLDSRWEQKGLNLYAELVK
jgi:predicted SAM-dependent methyltransferase